jgi:hypothetical protein
MYEGLNSSMVSNYIQGLVQEFQMVGYFCSVRFSFPKKIFYIKHLFRQSYLVPKPQEISLPGLEPRTLFLGCGHFVPDLSSETNNFGLVTVLLLCLVFGLQKLSWLGLELRIAVWACGLYSCNLLFQADDFCLGTLLVLCLVSELHELPSPGLELRTIFIEFWLCEISSWSYGISMPSLTQIGLSIFEL